MGYELVSCIELKDTQVYNHLTPIAMHPDVDVLWIVRSRKSEYGHIPKARYVLVNSKIRAIRWVLMLLRCLALARRRDVRGFVSFNPFPYGVIGFIAASLFSKPVHLGLIGTDWNSHATGPFSSLLLAFLRRASFLTIYGEGARREMVARGIESDRLAVLPHSISLERFPVRRSAEKRYAAMYVGTLSSHKRVDVILRGFALAKPDHPDARLCVVGDGPERPMLEELAHKEGISRCVDFVGFVEDVSLYLAQTRTIIMASQSEGFPFAIVEAICSGVIPITTSVNAIGEILLDGETALFFKEGDARGMASCLVRLLDDDSMYAQLSEKCMALRPNFSFDTALEVWRPWLNQLARGRREASAGQASAALGRR